MEEKMEGVSNSGFEVVERRPLRTKNAIYKDHHLIFSKEHVIQKEQQWTIFEETRNHFAQFAQAHKELIRIQATRHFLIAYSMEQF